MTRQRRERVLRGDVPAHRVELACKSAGDEDLTRRVKLMLTAFYHAVDTARLVRVETFDVKGGRIEFVVDGPIPPFDEVAGEVSVKIEPYDPSAQ